MYYDAGTDIEIKRRRKLAEALQKAGQQPEGTQMVSGLAVPNSPLAGLANAITGGIGQYQESQADKMETEQAKAKQALLSDALNRYGAGDTAGAMSALAQDPSMFDSSLKLAGLDIDRQKAERDNMALIAALGGKGVTTNPNAGYGAFPGGAQPSPLPTATGNMPLKQPTRSSNLVPSASGNAAFDEALRNGGAQVLEDMGGGGASPALQPLPESPPAMPTQSAADEGVVPLYQNGLPITDGAPKGYQWGTKPDGTRVPMRMQGIVTDETKAADAKEKINVDVAKAAKAFSELKKMGRSISTDSSFLQNKANQILNSGDIKIPFTGAELPGGQTLMQGTKSQSLINTVNAAIPSIFLALKPATEAGAKMFDSDKDVKFLTQMMANGTIDYEAAMGRLDSISRKFSGKGLDQVMQEYAPTGAGSGNNSDIPFDVPQGAKVTRIK